MAAVPAAAGGAPAGELPQAKCQCTREQWANVMAGLGVLGAAFIILVAVLNLMAFEDGIPGVMLNIYLIALALLAVLAELRIFKALRGLIYNILQFFYFLTSYTGRALYYIFLGSIVLDTSKPLMLIAAGCNMGLGVMLGIVHCRFRLPHYIDPQVAKMEAEERLRREIEEKFRSGQTPGATPNAGVAAAGGTAYAPPRL